MTEEPAPDDHDGSALYAAVDLGSNSFRLETASVRGGRYRREFYVKETVRLGAGLDPSGRLTTEATDRALVCLEAFARHLDSVEEHRIRAVATQTLREAKNRNEFLKLAQVALQHPIEVISGREEARLIFTGVSSMRELSEPTLVIDIGGRSTEMILGQTTEARKVESFAVGSVGMSMAYFPQGVVTEESLKAAATAAAAHFEEAVDVFALESWSQALGTSGTVNAVAQILKANQISEGPIDRSGLNWLVQRCLESGQSDQLDLLGLREDRKPVLAGGLAVLSALFDQFKLEHLVPTKGSLRQGVIFELATRLQAQSARSRELRDQTVERIQARFGIDLTQAQRVKALAEDLYFCALGPADPESLRELRWACDLHEIGMCISHHDHHRHSAYILAHAEAAGFSQSQMRRIAKLVLGQRGGLRKLELDSENATFIWMTLCLRLAVIFFHARKSHPGIELRLTRQSKSSATVFVSRASHVFHETLVYLLEQERDQWARSADFTLTLKMG